MNQPRSVFDFLKARGEEVFTQISNELMSNPAFLRAMQAAWKGKERIDDAVGQALRSMNVPTRAEFKKVMARLESLERELGELRQGTDVLRAEVKKAANDRAAAQAARAPAQAAAHPRQTAGRGPSAKGSGRASAARKRKTKPGGAPPAAA